MNKTLILSLGNPLRGDDGVGLAVLNYLETAALPTHVTLLDGGTAGLETVLMLQGYDRAIIIDAADMGLEAGAWRHFDGDQVKPQSGDLALRGTLHYAGLAEALVLGEALNLLPPYIEVYGIQPANIGWEEGLSPEVQHSVPQVAAIIAQQVANSTI